MNRNRLAKHQQIRLASLALALGLLLGHTARVRAEDSDPKAEPTPQQQAERALKRALDFVQNDAVKWRDEHQCASCHHGAMTVWVQNEARSLGYDVTAATLDESVEWTKTRFMEMVDRPYDPRPGYRMVGLGPILLAIGAQSAPKPDGIPAEELKRIAAHVVTRQQDDGAYEEPPPQNGPPPVFESREVMALWCSLVLEPHAAKDDPLKAQTCRDKIATWLAANKSTDTTQAQSLRLLLAARNGESREAIQPRIERLLKLQNADGGWSPVPEVPSDAYATGQVLYVLGLVGASKDRPEVERAVAFLVKTQREDGSWPMTPRAKPGARPFKSPVPITYFGSAWGTLGLLRTLPKPQATATP